MIEFLVHWVTAIATMMCEAGPYLLLGLMGAGLLKVLIPEEKIFHHLGKNNFRSVLTASILGVPLPLCSCAVLPTAMALKQGGASKGATTSFLIATPETGVDSVTVTWALLDPLLTVIRPLAALLTALGAGVCVNGLVRRGWDTTAQAPAATLITVDSHDHDCSHPHPPDPTRTRNGAINAGETPALPGWAGTLKAACAYGFGPLLDDLTPWFILGVMASGLITVLVPDGFFGQVLVPGWTSLLVMLGASIPLHTCATASTPLAAALIAKGLDPGAALVLLLVGPATNLATIAVVSNFLGRRVLFVYLFSIALFALFLGRLVNWLYAFLAMAPATRLSLASAESFGTLSIIAGVILALFLVQSARRLRLVSHALSRLRDLCRPLGFDLLSRAGMLLLALVVLGLYLSTAVTVVPAGSEGFVVCFGKVRQILAKPGLYVHAPVPLDKVEWLRRDEVHSVALGFKHRAEPTVGGPDADEDPGLGAAAAVVTGDENLLDIRYTVHYRVTDGYRFRFGIADPQALLSALAEASLRHMAAQRTSDEMLVGSRDALQQAVLALLQADLDRLGAGLQAVAVNLLYIHAPAQVHSAYRDVASALEDKETESRNAEGYQTAKLADVRATAYRTEQEAESAKLTQVQQAHGEATAFLQGWEAYRRAPWVTQLRLRRETEEQALASATVVLLLGDGVDINWVKLTPGVNATGPRQSAKPLPTPALPSPDADEE